MCTGGNTMSQKSEIKELWTILESESVDFSSSIGRRVINCESFYRTFAALNSKYQTKMLVLEIPEKNKAIIDKIPRMYGIDLTTKKFGDEMSGCFSFQISAVNKRVEDIFVFLAGDIIENIEECSHREQYADTVIKVLLKWQHCFEVLKNGGLSRNQQLGLYGELYWLESIVIKKGIQYLQYWKGPESASQDFQFDSCAVEVKSTLNEYKTKLNISNLLQLDKNSFNKLFLALNYFTEFKDTGDTLPGIIYRLEHKFSGTEWEELFKNCLLEEGYFSGDAKKYTSYYKLREQVVYDVQEGFPKIVKADIPAGITSCSYEIDMEFCRSYLINKKKIFECI
jgi:hypothetical protein